MYKEILQEYLLTYDNLIDKLERFYKRIEEFASDEAYQENVRKLSCFIVIKTVTALSMLTEIGDFKHFPLHGILLSISNFHLDKIREVMIGTISGLPKPETVMSVL